MPLKGTRRKEMAETLKSQRVDKTYHEMVADIGEKEALPVPTKAVLHKLNSEQNNLG